MNKFVLKLVDDYADSRYDDVVSYYVVETEKDITDVVEVYENAHEEWENDEDGEFDCLIAHIEMRLEENGMKMYPLPVDAELDF